MKYNIGDKVTLTNGNIMTIDQIDDISKRYRMKEDPWNCYTDEMIEGCVESIEDRLKELRKMCTISLTDSNYTDKVEVLLNDYEYIEENGKAFFVKKKKYPKTYEECCKIMDCAVHPYITANEPGIVSYYEDDLNRGILSLRKLRICRDAYWKIAGEEMGLGKPWEPDWDDDEWPDMYYISFDGKHIDKEKGYPCCNMILIFPTEEIRDAFKKNFDPDIEICKEFL